jgi:hypothetical protein
MWQPVALSRYAKRRVRFRRVHRHLNLRACRGDVSERLDCESHFLKGSAARPAGLHTDIEDTAMSVFPTRACIASKSPNMSEQFFRSHLSGFDESCIENHPMGIGTTLHGEGLIRPWPRRNERRKRAA